jgi:hypothetical protein
MPDQAGSGHRGHRLGELGLARPGRALDQHRLAQPVGEVHNGGDLGIRQVADAAQQFGHPCAGGEPVARRAVRIARCGRVFRACHPIAPQQNNFVNIQLLN